MPCAITPRRRGPIMDKFTELTGVAAPLPFINIDTDMIIPKQYLKTIKRTGLGSALFSEMRYNEDGSENPDFVLNKPAYRQAPDHRRRRQFRLRLVARARALGAARFRRALRDLDQLCRHLLQQLLQERHSADRRHARAIEAPDGRCRARLQRHHLGRPRRADHQGPGRRHASISTSIRRASRPCSKASTTSPPP